MSSSTQPPAPHLDGFLVATLAACAEPWHSLVLPSLCGPWKSLSRVTFEGHKLTTSNLNWV